MSSEPKLKPLEALSNEKWRVILEINLWPPQENFIDLSHCAKSGHFRLIDCAAFINDDKLRILESGAEFGDNWSKLPYSVISYIWRGQAVDPLIKFWNCLRIKGAEDGDPIKIDVLRTVCEASMLGVPPPATKFNPFKPLELAMIPRAEYLWLDQLCISQKDRSDKSSQIARMYDVYKHCTACFIVPGGLQRLVSLGEQTAWTHRAWTLQECIAPLSTFVLFSWSGNGLARLMDRHGNWNMNVIPIDRYSALTDFLSALRACTFGPLRIGLWSEPGVFPTGEPVWSDKKVTVRLFGEYDADLYPLHTILEDKLVRKIDSIRHELVWRCALARTSSRPVDMVFSIMGLLGVQLNPREFNVQDRLGATIAVAGAIFEQGGSADWLGIAPSIAPCPQLSSFPIFPETSVTGEIMVNSAPFRDQTNKWIYPIRAPRDGDDGPLSRIRGRVDAAGYIHFRRRACVVENLFLDTSDPGNCISTATDGKARRMREDLDFSIQPFPRTAVVPLWTFAEIDGGGSKGLDLLSAYTRKYLDMLAVIKEHSAHRFHIVAYSMQHHKGSSWESSRVDSWKEYNLSIGGPQPRLSSE